jgi:glycosyltransferase involved in cell wall biosynthesis
VAELAVLGQDPRFGGGALAHMEAFLAAARELGRDPELHYVPHPGLGSETGSSVLDRIEAIRLVRGGRRLAPRLRRATSLWVVAPLATHGSAALHANRPYACWVGTSLNDEWRGRLPGLGASRRLALYANAPALRRLERTVLRGASRVYATSPASRAGVAAAAGLDPERIALLPLPVDPDRFTPEPEERWRARLEAPVLAFVGRADDPRKNAALLLEALPLIRVRLPAARLRFIGRPPVRLPPGAEALGEVESVAEPLREASLLVLPSRQEGFGIAAAEALASGVPVLATPSGGPEALLRTSGGGRVLGGFEPEELATAALELLEDAATLSTMRRRGRAYVVREHSPRRLEELLAAALAELE